MKYKEFFKNSCKIKIGITNWRSLPICNELKILNFEEEFFLKLIEEIEIWACTCLEDFGCNCIKETEIDEFCLKNDVQIMTIYDFPTKGIHTYYITCGNQYKYKTIDCRIKPI